MTRATALQIYKHLPKKDCGRCKEKTCMAYAMKLSAGQKAPADCPLLTKKQRKKIEELIEPAVHAVTIGCSGNAITIGGEEVMYRHEYRYVNPTALFIEVSDNMIAAEIDKRIDFVKNFQPERLGKKQRLDGISVKCSSGDKARFSETVEWIAKKYSGPLILSSDSPECLDAAAASVKDRRPLLYSASPENWMELKRIAKKHDTSLALHSTDPDILRRTAKKISSTVFSDLVIDPGISWEKGLSDTVDILTLLRRSAADGVKDLGHPLMGSTASVHEQKNKDMETCAYNESLLAGLLVCRYASLIIMRTIEPWALLPVMTLRQSLYSDPTVEPSVEAKLYSVGAPDSNSPLIVTTNFALTYYSVAKDLEGAGVSAYILVVDTGGLAVTVALAAEKLTSQVIKEALANVKETVSHKKVIIPGAAAQLKTDLETASGWTVLTGPEDSSALPAYLKDSWRTP
jgi:acetyl-CoA decarbonylase/synthase, CODH/ACS complex subunit gamma